MCCILTGATYGSNAPDDIFIDGVLELDLAVQRMLLIIADQLNQALKLGRADQEQATLLLDAAVLDLVLGPENMIVSIFHLVSNMGIAMKYKKIGQGT